MLYFVDVEVYSTTQRTANSRLDSNKNIWKLIRCLLQRLFCCRFLRKAIVCCGRLISRKLCRMPERVRTYVQFHHIKPSPPGYVLRENCKIRAQHNKQSWFLWLPIPFPIYTDVMKPQMFTLGGTHGFKIWKTHQNLTLYGDIWGFEVSNSALRGRIYYPVALVGPSF